ncbi:hypothetical protein L596_009682 [Steinernema carpocapsae]|uniref:Uncharacterized protein n=1 Tax=Steinernema carpocapsae TaxID=34508 RepID=A0A4V6A6M8_STECR|nr:hypothetical protein L596_009682 [Steinernema carpocapsae]
MEVDEAAAAQKEAPPVKEDAEEEQPHEEEEEEVDEWYRELMMPVTERELAAAIEKANAEQAEAQKKLEKVHVYPLPRDRFSKNFFFGHVEVKNKTTIHRGVTQNMARIDIYDHITHYYTTFFIDDGIYDVVFCEGRQEFYFSGMKQSVYCFFYVSEASPKTDYLVIRRQYSRDDKGRWSYTPVFLDNTITKGPIAVDKNYYCIDRVHNPTFEKCRNAPILIAAETDHVCYVINSHLESEGCSVFRNNDHLEDLDSKVILLDAGNTHILLLTENNQLYTYGNGSHGQLGHGKLTSEKTPKLVEYFENFKVLDMAAGPFQTIVISDDGEACGCGWNATGQLGTEINDGDIVPTPLPMMSLEDENSYVSAFASDGSTALQTSEGDVVILSKNKIRIQEFQQRQKEMAELMERKREALAVKLEPLDDYGDHMEEEQEGKEEHPLDREEPKRKETCSKRRTRKSPPCSRRPIFKRVNKTV